MNDETDCLGREGPSLNGQLASHWTHGTQASIERLNWMTLKGSFSSLTRFVGNLLWPTEKKECFRNL